MPIVTDNFAAFEKTATANRAACNTMGAAAMQVAIPACPVKTGNLRRSHTMAVNDTYVDVGVTAEYGGYVHNGTSRQKPQPWLRDSVNRNKEAIVKVGAEAWMRAYQK